MNGFLRLLVLICAVSKLSAQILNDSEEEENVRWNLLKVFGESPKSVHDSTNCQCVPYNQCYPASYRILDIQEIHCPYMRILCCPFNRLRSISSPKPRRGCGIRNVGGLNDIGYGIQYKSEFGEFPWTVAVLNSGNYSFAGTLIHPRVVLTAAHRVQNLGIYTIRVQKIIEHPTFSPVSFENDAALLILKQSFELNDHINVICLPDQGAAPPPTSVCYANGWSKNEYDDSVRYSTRMKRIPLHIGKCIDRSSIFGQTIYPHTSFLCAAGLRSLYIGDGDGGGPLACPLENPRENRYQLSGILSLKFVNLEGLVSDVSSMRSWIDQEMTANNFDKSYYTA